MQGIIKKVKETYGFILIEDDRQVFFHLSTWLSKLAPTEGDAVEFDLVPSHKPQFKEHAVKVRKIRTETASAASILAGKSGSGVQS